MTAGERQGVAISCATCDTTVEVCAFCERADCGHTICYRCLRIELRESLAHPHAHGG
jgi:hypothetical protein